MPQQYPDPAATDASASVRRILAAQAALCRAALGAGDVEALLGTVCSLVADALGSPAVAFFETIDDELVLIAGLGAWESDDRPRLQGVAPAPAATAVALRDLPALERAIAASAPWHGGGLAAGLRGPEGRPAALVVALDVIDELPGEATDLVGLAAELAGAGWGRRRLEEEVRGSEQRLVQAQELAHMGSYDWDIVRDENQWSDELYRIYGFEPQSFNASYDRFLSLLHPDERDKIIAVHQSAYQSLEPYAMDERIVRPDGSVRILESTGEVIADETGRPIRMRGVCIDVTDRRRVEADVLRLDQAEDHRRQALEINDNVVQGLTSILWTLGRGAESTAQEITKRTLDSARSMMSRLLDLGGDIAAGDLTRSAAPEAVILDALSAAAPTVAPSTDDAPPVRLVLADDSDDIRLLLRIQLEAHGGFELVGEATTGPDAVVQCAEHQPDVVLLDMAMPGGDGLSAIPGILAAAPGTKIVALSGFSADRLAGPALDAGASAYVEKGSFEDLIAAIVAVAPQLDRTTISAAPTRPALDIDRAMAGHTEVAVAVGHLVHELRTPVAVVSGIVDMLARSRDELSSAAADELYEALLRNTSVLSDQVARATEGFSAASSGLHRESVDVGQLLEVTVRDLASLPGVPSIEVVLPPAAVIAQLDQLRVQQVLVNLLTNATRFAGEGGTVRAAMRGDREVVEIVIEDDGPGVDPEVGDQVFQAFVKDEREPGGLGLGLYVSRTIARSHGGDLTLATSAPVGARFVLTLPRDVDARSSSR